MADYSRFKTDTLKKMREKAYEKYCYETTKPSGLHDKLDRLPDDIIARRRQML